MSIQKLFLTVCVIFTLISCGGGGGSGTGGETPPDVGSVGTLSYSPATCSDEDQLAFVYEAMHDVYLWYEDVPELDYTSYTNSSELISDMRTADDLWSYSISQTDYNAYYSGAGVGLGMKFTYYSSVKEIYITFVYPDSPAEKAGLERGFELLTINGYTASDIIDNNLWDDAFGPSEKGYITDFLYIDNSGQTGTASVVKDEYYSDSAPKYSIFTNSTNGKKIGYLLFMTFSHNYSSDLQEAFTAFENENISELVLDLRYNGGGQNSATRYLGTNIAGSPLLFNIMYYYLHNSRYESWDRSVSFTIPAYSLSIEKIVFITTGQTASASELLISSLSPYMQTYQTGTATYGKPVGMYVFGYCDNYLVPVSFATVNSEFYGGYFDGLPADCLVYDDVTSPLGSTDENMLASALSYLETGSCVRKKTAAEKPEYIKRKGIHRIFDSY